MKILKIPLALNNEKGKKWNTSYELDEIRIHIYKLRVQTVSCEFKPLSYELKYTSYRIKSVS